MSRGWLGGLLLACLACGQPPGRTTPPPARAEGSVCAEHGVLAAVCTKCNPALAPVFQAKGDWCVEHGFPESFCPHCNPARAGRPVGGLGASEPPADGTRVRFKNKEVARLAGIEVASAGERPGGSGVAVAAKIVYDSARQAEVNPRVPGVVHSIRADIGTSVRAGTPLAVIESAELGDEQSRVQAARSRVTLAQTIDARESQLYREGIAAERDAQAARAELDAARAELASAESTLAMIGGVAEGVPRYTLGAPIAGVVIRRQATVGRMVQVDEVLFEIVDTTRMWAEVQIPETELARVQVGQTVTLRVQGIPERLFRGRLDYVAPQIEPATRTAAGRVVLPNPDGTLRGNMFADAWIGGDARSSVVVPRAALQRARGADLVFVRLAEDLFEARRVQAGWADADVVEVRGRVAPGDEVATAGSFLLKTETLKESIGAGCCEVEGPR